MTRSLVRIQYRPQENRDLTAITRETQLFGRFVRLASYDNYPEDILDVWFRRTTELDEELSIGNESAMSTFRYRVNHLGDNGVSKYSAR